MTAKEAKENFAVTTRHHIQFRYIDENSRATRDEWTKKYGYKFLHKDVVDWCGFSPIGVHMPDATHLLNIRKRMPVFFTRKVDPGIDDERITALADAGDLSFYTVELVSSTCEGFFEYLVTMFDAFAIRCGGSGWVSVPFGCDAGPLTVLPWEKCFGWRLGAFWRLVCECHTLVICTEKIREQTTKVTAQQIIIANFRSRNAVSFGNFTGLTITNHVVNFFKLTSSEKFTVNKETITEMFGETNNFSKQKFTERFGETNMVCVEAVTNQTSNAQCKMCYGCSCC